MLSKNTYPIIPCVILTLGFILHYILPPYAKILSDTVIFIAVLVHSANLCGTQCTIIYAITAMSIGYSAEFIGTHTGWIFGSYHYNQENNIGMIMDVPFAIPIIYVILLYAGTFVCIAISNKFLAKKNLWILSLMTGFLLTQRSLVTDPIQSTVYKNWIWDKGGDYFNVPIQNFIGWFFVFCFMTMTTLRLSWHRKYFQKIIHINKKIFYFPLLLFFSLLIFGLTSALGVAQQFRPIGNVCAFISVFILAPYLFVAWFNSIKNTTSDNHQHKK